MKSFFRNALFMGLFAAVSVFLMRLFLSDILFSVVHAAFGDIWYFPPYFLSVLAVTSGIMIFGWRIHVSREEGEEKREFLKSIEGQEFDPHSLRAARRQDKRHRTVLLSALAVSVIEGLFVANLPYIGPFQFGLFWLVENIVYVKKRKVWGTERLHR